MELAPREVLRRGEGGGRCRGIERAVAILVGVFAIAALSLVDGCARHDAPSAAPPPPPLPPTPARLLATGSIARPDEAWADVQKQLGTLGAFLPSTFAGVIGSLFDVDAELAALVDGGAPLYFAVEAGEVTPGKEGLSPSAPRWALAMPVKDVARVAALLHVAPPAADAGAVELYPRKRSAGDTAVEAGGAVAAPSSDLARADAPLLGRVTAAPRYLVLASDGTASLDLAPYVTRVLPDAPRLAAAPDAVRALLVDVPHDALAGPLVALVSSRWAEARAALAEQAASARERHGGRAADFADPDAVLKLADGVVAEALTLLADLDHASLRLDLGADSVSALVTLTPVAGGATAAPWVKTLAACDLEPLGAESLDAPFAALVCSNAEGRTAFAAALGAGLRAALGSRLSAADGDRLDKALRDLARARGDWLTGALAPGGGLRLDTAIAPDAAPRSASEAVGTLVDLTRAPGIAEPLAANLGVRVRPPRDSVAIVDRLAPDRAAARPAHAAHPAAPPPLSIEWATHAESACPRDRLAMAAGPDVPTLLRPPSSVISDDPHLRNLLAELASPTFALLVQPQLATSAFADARPHAGIALAFGATGEPPSSAYLRLAADPGLARSLLRLAAGL